MYHYQRPGPSQSTNIRANKLLIDSLVKGMLIEVHALPDNGLLFTADFTSILPLGSKAICGPAQTGLEQNRHLISVLTEVRKILTLLP